MIVITGAAGFIGSCLVQKLNEEGYRKEIIVVDDFYKDYKDVNLENKFIRDWIHRDIFLDWFRKSARIVEFVFHLGARTDTSETDVSVFDRLNVNYSKSIWQICARHQIPVVYASSAATYGLGVQGFSDDHTGISSLKPLNAYGRSKQEFDQWVLEQVEKPPLWVGMKFFNVYGPNEFHKGRMASVILHAHRQIREHGRIRLFRSHRADCEDGHQKRDFVYVKDVVDVCHHFMETEGAPSGIYNVGTGKAHTFLDLANALFASMDREAQIEFTDTPADIRATYQYFTEAQIDKLRSSGFQRAFHDVGSGVQDYVTHYLKPNRTW